MLKNEIDGLRKREDLDSRGRLYNRNGFHGVWCACRTYQRRAYGVTGPQSVGSRRPWERINATQMFVREGYFL